MVDCKSRCNLRFVWFFLFFLAVIQCLRGDLALHTVWVRDLDDPSLVPPVHVSKGPNYSVYFAGGSLKVGRYDSQGTLVFRERLLPSAEFGVIDRATDPEGNLILCGAFNGTLGETYYYRSPFLLMISPAGEILWTNTFPQTFNASMGAVCTDASGNVYVAGYFAENIDFGTTNLVNLDSAANDAFLSKYSSDGELIWVQAIGGADYDYFSSLSVDQAGDLWVSGRHPSDPALGSDGAFVGKLRPSGEWIFKKPHLNMELFATGTLEPFMWNVYWRRYPWPEEYSADPQLGRFRSDGEVRWFTEGFGGHGYQNFIDPAQDEELSTYFLGLAGFSAASVAGIGFPEAPGRVTLTKLDQNGQAQWAKSAVGLSPSAVHSLSVANRDNLFIAAQYGDSTQLGYATLDRFVLPKTNTSIFVAKYGRLSANAKPSLTLPPRDVELVAGRAGFIVAGAASVSPLAFQWYFNGIALTAETNTFIALSPVQLSHEGDYKIRVSNDYGSVTSAPIHLTVRRSASVVEQPVGQIVYAGGSSLLRVVAGGDEPLSYQWQFKNASLTGETNATLTLSNVAYFQQGDYSVSVTNLYGSVLSSSVWVTVLSPPILARTNYFELPIIAGSNLTLLSYIAGTEPVEFQWYEQGIPIAGARGVRLELPQNYSDGPFTVVAWNRFGAVTNDQLWPLRLMHPLSVIATNQTDSSRMTALAPAGQEGFFSLKAPPADIAGSTSVVQRRALDLSLGWSTNLSIWGSASFPRSLVSDAGTNLYVLGDFKNELNIGPLRLQGGGFSPKLFLAAVSPSGEPQWARSFGLEGTNVAAKARVAHGFIWAAGNALIPGRNPTDNQAVTFTNVHLAQFDSAGSLVWSNTFKEAPRPTGWTSEVSGLSISGFAIDSQTNFLVAGRVVEFVRVLQPREAALLAKYDRAGQLLWNKFFLSTNRLDRAGRLTAVEIGPDGDLLITGFFSGYQVTSFLAKVSPAGEERWIVYAKSRYPVTGSGPVFQTIAFSPAGTLLIGGYSSSGFLVELPYNAGGFALEFSTDGQLIAPTVFGISGTFLADLLTLQDRVYTAGYLRRFSGGPTAGQLHALGTVGPKISNAFSHFVFSSDRPVALRPLISGSGPVSFQWYRNNQPLDGQTNSFLNPDFANPTLSGAYQLVVQNSVGTATNQPIYLSSMRVRPAESGSVVTLWLAPSQRYRLERRDDFAPGSSWVPWLSLTDEGEPITAVDEESRFSRFYRLMRE